MLKKAPLTFSYQCVLFIIKEGVAFIFLQAGIFEQGTNDDEREQGLAILFADIITL